MPGHLPDRFFDLVLNRASIGLTLPPGETGAVIRDDQLQAPQTCS
jgi:hypothetical protein